MGEELLEQIRAEREAGLTYAEIIKKHNLKSNNLIKVALGKTTGGDKKYRGRTKQRFKELKETERKYNLLVIALKELFKDVDILRGLINEDY